MKKMASVLEVGDKGTARIMLYKHKKCHGCGACNKHMHPGSILTAFNSIQIKEGDMVDVNVHKKFSLTEFSVMYLLPVAAFFAGLMIGILLFPGKSGGGVSVFLAFLLLLGAIAANFIFRKKYHPNYTVTIVKVILPAEPKL